MEKIAWNNKTTCEICGKAVEEGRTLCKACTAALNSTPTRHCEERSDEAIQSSHENAGIQIVRKAYSCVTYGTRESDMVGRMKYAGRTHIADELAQMMADKLKAECADVKKAYHYIVPVPMSIAKKKKRGYDQAELLAARLAKLTGIPLKADVIQRIYDTNVMSSLSAQQRRISLDGAFEPLPGAEEKLKGKTILLTDDVCTTGSSADAAASALKKAGAEAVDLLTFASGADMDVIY
jgi:ComF family protein